MKFLRFERLLAATALSLAVAVVSLPSMAQQQPDQQTQTTLPLPEYPVPLTATASDDNGAAAQPSAEAKLPLPGYPVPLPTAAIDGAAAATAAASDSSTPAKATASDSAAPAKAAASETAPAPSVADAAADSAIADQLREVITGKSLDRLIVRKADREGVERYYKDHDYAPLWLKNGVLDERAKAAIAYLKQVDADGLDPRDYPVPDFAAATTPEARATAELKFTNSVLNYAREAQTGRISFTRVGADIQFNPIPPKPEKVLAKLAEASDVGASLDGYNPPQHEFKALKEKLAELRKGQLAGPAPEKPKPIVQIPDGKTLHLGMKDKRVIPLRKRLEISENPDSTLYDDTVRDAVKAFQTGADLADDGALGPNTRRALNGEQQEHHAVADPIDTVIVNMERWRWLPRDLGNPHVIVNVPDYTLTLYNDGKPYWHTKIVAGQPGKATPMLSAEMKYITVNPTWNVPPSIIEKEYLPALQEDPTVLDRYGLKIYQDPDGTVHIYQPPGAGNALGRIRFNFPNKFLVYQHDTPDKYLFARKKRAYSHGCMRVQDPLVYGEKLLGLVDPEGHYTVAKLQSMFGDDEININFPKPVWVHLTYQTAFVDADGKLEFHDDVYGRDARMIAILKGPDRRVADIPVERPPNESSKPVRMSPGTFTPIYGGGGGGGGGGGFFDWLFGGGAAQAGPRPQYYYRPPGFIGPRAANYGSYRTR